MTGRAKVKDIQRYPVADSPAMEPFESIVEIYYQLKGYITSSNKWFWVWGNEKKQRGYRDIDVLAINSIETLIVSVSINLDDKIAFTRDGSLNEKKMSDLVNYFEMVELYLFSVADYSWLVSGENKDKDRKVKHILAYAHGKYEKEKKQKKLEENLKNYDIELLYLDEIISFLEKEISNISEKGLKTDNQLVKMIKLWKDYNSH